MAAADPIAASPVYPRGSRVNERGHLEVGGCDVVELAAEHRHPRLRLRRGRHALARPRVRRAPSPSARRDFEVIYASKAFPCTAAYRADGARRACPSTWPPGGELHMALARGVRPGPHPPARQQQEPRASFATRSKRASGSSSSTPSTRSSWPDGLLDRPQRVLIRVTPGIKASTHSYVQTGQLDSKFGFGLADGLAERAVERGARVEAPRAGRPARPHRLPDLRAGALREGDRGARRLHALGGPAAGAAQRRRRPRHRLPRRRRAARRSRTTSTSRSAGSSGSSTRCRGSWSSRGARWSATRASPPTGSGP